MTRSRNPGPRRSPGPLKGPAFDENALVVTVHDPGILAEAAASFTAGQPAATPALDLLHEYVRRNEGSASLTMLSSGERLPESPGLEKARWELGVAASVADGEPPPPTVLHLKLASPADRALVEEVIRNEPAITAHPPAVFYPPDVPKPFPGVHKDHQWALERCGFRHVWDELDSADHPVPIAVIDSGRHTGHPDLEGCIVRHEPPLDVPQDESSVHASSVAGVLAALRGNKDEKGMAGCCSAKVHLFNVWKGVFDYEAFYRALEDVMRSDTRVVNVSLTASASDPTVDALIARCVRAGKVLVAAMGDFAQEQSPKMFPAASEGVIAVGATNRLDRRSGISSKGGHIWISAPGTAVWTIFGPDDYEPLSGTSYAAPMVSAAAWLALRKRPELTLDQVKILLSRSVAPRPKGNGASFEDIGHGRLDMMELSKALPHV